MSDIGTWTGLGVQPSAESATIILDKTLRIEFSEAMADNVDLRSLLSYTITPNDPSSVEVEIVSLTLSSDSKSIDLLVDVSFTNGTDNYSLAINTNLEDVAGNTLDPASATIDFDGYGPRPIVEGANVASNNSVLISFSEGMKSNAALTTPGNYVFTTSTGPEVAPSSIEIVSSTIVKANLDAALGIGDVYFVAVSNVKSLSENLIAETPLNKAEFSWLPFTSEITDPNEVLPLKKYDFLIREIREQDRLNGNQFVERFLEGGQAVWEETISKIFSVKNLWSVEDCPDDYLEYLKAIVGWTGSAASLTNNLEPASLRRLISLSTDLWRKRGTETAIIDVLNVFVPSRVRIWNWFDVRWMTDEVGFDEMRRGFDPWLFSMPLEESAPEHWSTIRMVDPGEDMRATVRKVVDLMRPLGENFLVVYLLFLDLFEIDGDLSQWDASESSGAVVDGGTLQLTDSSREVVLANVTGSELWSESMIFARLKGTKAGLSGKGLRVDFLNKGGFGYCVYLDLFENKLVLASTEDFELTTIDSFDFSTVPYELQENVWYGIRIQTSWESDDLRVIVFEGGVERINCLIDSGDVVSEEGTAGLGHESGVTLEVSDFEVLGLPVESETIEIE